MTSKVLYPALSEDGWVSDSVKVADQLFSTFLTASDYSQTYLYTGYVSSLPYIIQNNQNNISNTLSSINRTLNSYFGRYFDNVVVDTLDSSDPLTPSKVSITIYVKFTDVEKKDFTMGKIIEYSDTIINKIVAINNG